MTGRHGGYRQRGAAQSNKGVILWQIQVKIREAF